MEWQYCLWKELVLLLASRVKDLQTNWGTCCSSTQLHHPATIFEESGAPPKIATTEPIPLQTRKGEVETTNDKGNTICELEMTKKYVREY
jgi:hypothetical protein